MIFELTLKPDETECLFCRNILHSSIYVKHKIIYIIRNCFSGFYYSTVAVLYYVWLYSVTWHLFTWIYLREKILRESIQRIEVAARLSFLGLHKISWNISWADGSNIGDLDQILLSEPDLWFFLFTPV